MQIGHHSPALQWASRRSLVRQWANHLELAILVRQWIGPNQSIQALQWTSRPERGIPVRQWISHHGPTLWRADHSRLHKPAILAHIRNQTILAL
jgi:hypothetical protein